MIATDTHLYLGIPRTGCLFVCRVLEAAFGATLYGRKPQHTPLCEIPEAKIDTDKILVGTLRNPWEWYVSRWRYFYDHAKPEKRMPFAEYMDRYFSDYQGPISKATERLPNPQWPMGVYTYLHVAYFMENAPLVFSGMDQSLFERRYDQLLDIDEMMRMETLPEDVVRVFGPAARDHLGKGFKNASNHGDYTEYYDDEWVERVAKADEFLIWRYNFKFGG